jgi:hypothetical protein
MATNTTGSRMTDGNRHTNCNRRRESRDSGGRTQGSPLRRPLYGLLLVLCI